MGKFLRVYFGGFTLSVLLLLLISGRAFAQPKITPIIIPEVQTLHLGEEPSRITIVARVDREVQFQWKLEGPGSLEGDSNSREIVYVTPAKIDGDTAEITITVEALDFRGNSTTEPLSFTLISSTPIPTPTPTPSASSKNIYAVVIAGGKYQDENIPPLKFAENDVQAFYNTLIDADSIGLAEKNIRFLSGEEVTNRNVKKAIGKWLKESTTEDDIVIIYIVGHGAFEDGQPYWVTYNTESSDLYSTALGRDEIHEMLSRIPADQVIVFFDGLHSINDEQVKHEVFGEMYSKEGSVLVGVSGPASPLEEVEEQQHGIFTYYLLEGLGGKADENSDSTVTLEELWSYVKQQVLEFTQGNNADQAPFFYGDITKVSLTFPAKESSPPPNNNRRERIIEVYRTGEISTEQFKKAINLLDSGGKDQILEDFLDGKLPIEMFKEIF